MADAIRKLAKSIVGERKPRNSSAIGTVKGFRNGSAIVLLDNAVATVPCALNVDAAIGDRVSVDVRDHVATVTANHSVKSGAEVEQRLAALEQTTDDLEGQQDVDREDTAEVSTDLRQAEVERVEFKVHTDQYNIGAINGGAYGDHTFQVPIDGQIIGVPNAYADSKAIAILGHRVDFEANTVRIDYRNVSDSKNTANLGVIHIAVVVAV